jgi:hypothetical protein
MKPRPAPSTRRGATLIEMSVVICVLLALMSTGLYFSYKIGEWKAGKEAGETLRAVYAAQRMYLADHPTAAVNTITSAQLLPYMPNSPSVMPVITSLDDKELDVNVAVSPPVVSDGNGAAYDPSGSPSDSLWDVGE